MQNYSFISIFTPVSKTLFGLISTLQSQNLFATIHANQTVDNLGSHYIIGDFRLLGST